MPRPDGDNPQFDHDPLLARMVLLIYWPLLAVATHWPKLNPQIAGRSMGDLYLDKPVHFLAFGLLEGLIFRALPMGRACSLRLNLFGSILITSTYAYIDEYTQVFTQRHPSTTDLLFNMLGILAAMGLSAARVRDDHPSPPDNTFLARLSIIAITPLMLLAAFVPNFTFEAPFGLPMGPVMGDEIEMRGDHVVHIFVAFMATWLLAWAMPLGRKRPRLSVVVSVLLVAMSGVVVEMVQRHTGRGFEISDIVAHCTGSLLAILTGWGYLIAISKYQPQGVVALRDADKQTVASTRCESGAQGENVCTTGTGLTSGAQQDGTPKETSGGGVARHARTVMGMTILSRFTGLFRDSMLASLFGLGPTAVAFTMGFLIPNLFRRLFGEGALSAAFIPQYTTLLHEDRKLARRFAWAMVSLLMVGLSVIVLITEAVLFGLLEAGTWTDTTDLTLRLVMVMMPYMPLVCTVALVGGMLQVHGKFGPTAAAPILLNLAMIMAAVIGHLWVGAERGVYLVAVFVLVAGVLQLLWQVAAVWRDEPGTLDFANTRKPLKAVMLTMGPMLLGLAVFQINSAMDMFISYGFSSPPVAPEVGGAEQTVMAMIAGKKLYYPIQAGAVAALNWSQRLYQFPLGVFGIAVATAIFPALAKCAASDRAGFDQTLRNGLRLTVFIGLPASVGLIMVRLPLTRLIFQYGKFDLEDASRVATILVGYAIAIWAYSATHVLTRGFYALKDPRTPLKITMVNVMLNLTLNCVLIWYLGAAGLAWSTAICAIWQTFLLVRAMRRYVKMPLDDAVLFSWCRTLVLSAIMGMVLYPLINRVDLTALNRQESAGMLAILVAVGAGVYLAGAWLLKSDELRWLLKRQAR